MPKFLFCFLLVVAFPLMGQSAAPEPGDQSDPAIGRLREGLLSSFKKRDLEAFLSYLDPEVVATWQNGEVCHGSEAVRAFYNRTMTGDQRIVKDLQLAPEVLGTQVSGDSAVSWGNLHDHVVLANGSDLVLNSVFTATVARKGDRWVLKAFHTSVNAFENPVLTLTVTKAARWLGFGGTVGGLIMGFGFSRLFGRKDPPPGVTP